MGNIVIVGASRGLGASLAAGLPKAGDEVWCISRTRPDVLDRPDSIRRTWVQCDLSDPVNTGAVKKILMDTPVDLFIYNAAIWDKHTFSGLKDAEVVAIIHVNLTSLLISLRDLFPNIAASGNGKVVLIGSTSGLENEGARLVVYPATKFAMRGAAHALRKLFRPVGVPVTVISPGSMA